MTKLRLVPVEYKVCGTAGCDIEYEGETCPRCGQAFEATRGRKRTHDRLILVSEDPPLYEREPSRYRCPDCGNVYGLAMEDIVACARCAACQQPLLSKGQLEQLWKGAQTLLQYARRLDRARREVPGCPHCAHPVLPVCWCPWCRTALGSRPSRCLPQRATTVWIRTHYVRASLDNAASQRP